MTQSKARPRRATAVRAATVKTLPGLLCLAALAVTVTAHAQADTHSKAPIDITADRAEVSNARCVAIWRGSAEVIQEKTHLRADTITVYSRPKAKAAADAQTTCGGAERIEAEGHVYYMTPDQNARGDHAVYNQSRDEVVMTGDVVVVQGQNVARGERLTIKASTHEATMDSSGLGPGKPHRVRAVFYPDKTPDADKAASSAAAGLGQPQPPSGPPPSGQP